MTLGGVDGAGLAGESSSSDSGPPGPPGPRTSPVALLDSSRLPEPSAAVVDGLFAEPEFSEVG